MPVYTVNFYRADEPDPFHTWAPFYAVDVDDANATARQAIEDGQRSGDTLAEAANHTLTPIEET